MIVEVEVVSWSLLGGDTSQYACDILISAYTDKQPVLFTIQVKLMAGCLQTHYMEKFLSMASSLVQYIICCLVDSNYPAKYCPH